MVMDSTSTSLRLREMEGRYNSGFSSLDRAFLDSLYFELFGKPITNTGCSSCYRDAYIEICTKFKREKKMVKTTDFQLKAGAVLTFFGSPIAYTNSNLTDEVALRYLALNPNNMRMFSHLPSNWEARLAEYKKNGTIDNGRKDVETESAIVALEGQLAEATAAKTAAELEVVSLKEELAGANSSLENALSERDALAADNEILKAERDKLIVEVESLKSKTTSRSKKTTSKETATPVSSEQSLDLGE